MLRCFNIHSASNHQLYCWVNTRCIPIKAGTDVHGHHMIYPSDFGVTLTLATFVASSEMT